MAKKKYGLLFEKPKKEDYVFGAFSLVPFEILIYKKYGLRRNYSDRFLATVVGTRGKGATPQEVCEFLRKIGVVSQETWPFDESINTEDRFFAKSPPKLYELAAEFNREWNFKHEYVPSEHNEISKALTSSPLLISVYGWKERNGKFYRPSGVKDNHATTMFYQRDGEFRRVFDSYDYPHIKDVEWESVPKVVKRFWIEKKTYPHMSIYLDFWRKIWYNIGKHEKHFA